MHWKLKALTQFGFAKLPYGVRFNHLAQRARGAFKPAAQMLGLLPQGRYLRAMDARLSLEGIKAVEIGPGWQGVGTLLLHLFGVKSNFAVDHKPHLRFDRMIGLAATARRNVAELAEAMGKPEAAVAAKLDLIPQARDLPALLAQMGVTYAAPGDAAATGLPDASVDLVFSYGVLEHIPRDALAAISEETRRILKPEGRACHNIGLHDHFHNAGLGNGVNFLRYSQRVWDFWNANAILYHNRMRLPEYLELFAKAGLEPIWQDREVLDLNREALRKIEVHPDFRHFSEDDLIASHLYIDLKPA